MARGFVAPVIRTEFHAPGSQGLSATAMQVLVEHPHGPTVSFELPVVRHDRFEYLGDVTHKFVPVEQVPADRVGYMYGGALIQVRSDLATALGLPAAYYPLHDRSESRLEYAANSD